MNKTNKKTPTVAIVFYVFSVIFLLFFAFNMYYSYDYLSKLGAQVSYSEDWAAVLSIYSGQCIPSLAGALACYGFGFVITKLQTTQNVLMECIEDAVADDEEEAFVNQNAEIKVGSQVSNKAVDTKPEETEEAVVEETKTEEKA